MPMLRLDLEDVEDLTVEQSRVIRRVQPVRDNIPIIGQRRSKQQV